MAEDKKKENVAEKTGKSPGAARKHASFNVGDTVVVSVRIQEEGKSRLQDFEGIVIAKKGSGVTASFTVRRISYGEGVERVFPLSSPLVDKIRVVKRGRANRAKLYYLRKKVGKKGKVDEVITDGGNEEDAVSREEGA